MKLLFPIVAFTGILTSCTTFEDINGGLTTFHGQPVNSLIQVLGFPDSEQSIAGNQIVSWHSEQNITSVTPVIQVTSYSNGRVNTYGAGGYGNGNYNSTTTSYEPTTVNYNCTLKVAIDQRDRILSHDFEGNIGGCEQYAAALRPYLPQS